MAMLTIMRNGDSLRQVRFISGKFTLHYVSLCGPSILLPSDFRLGDMIYSGQSNIRIQDTTHKRLREWAGISLPSSP